MTLGGARRPMTRVMAVAMLLALGSVLVACSEVPPPTPVPTQTPASGRTPPPMPVGSPVARRQLPPLIERPQVPDCGSLDLGAPTTLEGSVADGVYADSALAGHVPLRWTSGYIAEFYPTLVIRSLIDGRVVALEGENLADGFLGDLHVCAVASPAGGFIELLAPVG